MSSPGGGDSSSGTSSCSSSGVPRLPSAFVNFFSSPFPTSQNRSPAANSNATRNSTPASTGSNRSTQLPSFCQKRLEKERRELLQRPPDSICLRESENNHEWLVDLRGAEESLYENEQFTLRFRFSDRYPLDSPEVIFVGTPPVHPHVYSNGHICLNILYDGWSPALSVVSITLSLISMLCSCTQKRKPLDDASYVRMVSSHVSPKHMRWIFHDDTV